jgi:tetratricopeptide (TPR) repeat protein
MLAAAGLARQNANSAQSQSGSQATTHQRYDANGNPPEEDKSYAQEKFVFDPLEAKRNLKIGDFYWRKGDYLGAKNRYLRAVKFNPHSAEAFYKLGRAEEKLHHTAAAKAALKKAIQIAPDSKIARKAKKQLGNKS